MTEKFPLEKYYSEKLKINNQLKLTGDKLSQVFTFNG